jgi:hypothetical protein
VPRLCLLVLSVLLLASAGCKTTPAPYARSQAPTSDELLAVTQPRVGAISVPHARVVADRVARADLAFIAQSPNRFRGSITKSGNELVTLALHEEGYALRYHLDEFPPGFYAGPLDPCAVRALLGVELAPEGLVALVLGGSPVIDPPLTVLDQGWDRRQAHERLVVANDRYVQELHFQRTEGRWVFSGSALFRRGQTPTRRRRRRDPGELVWSLEHEGFDRVGDHVLPGQTRLRAPGPRRDHRIIITYRERSLDPPWARQTAPSTTNGTGPDADDGWEEDPWEEGEWENAEEPEREPEPAPEPAPKPAPEPEPAIPEVFRLQPTGLTPRGDLCR